MNRGRHKKNKKENNIYSKDTILSYIRRELVEPYRISKQQQIRTSDPILINNTISNTIYTIRCHFGYKETKFKYKHE